MVRQYGKYTLLDTIHVNGELTLGENLADLGGVTIAYDAFKLTKQGRSNELIDGFTPDQRFFLSWAQVWRVVQRPERLRTMLNIDPHAPEKFRVLGPLSNFEPFYKAFGVSPGNKMYRSEQEQVKVW
jgi:putative endopeptidase